MNLKKKTMNLIWTILRTPDGRKVAKWVSEGKMNEDYAARLYLEGRLTKMVALPNWLSSPPAESRPARNQPSDFG